MSTASLEETTTAAQDGRNSSDPPSTNAKKSNTDGRLYRVIWRWHFYAGVIVAPVLITLAATGALYIFKDELEAVIYPGVTYVEPAAARATYEEQLATARAAAPAHSVVFAQVFTNPARATSLAMVGEKFQFTYVDPYRGNYLGTIQSACFFDIVLSLHRTMFLGTTGRVIIELTTCWTIVLLATGVYLWWPRKANQLWGVWLPRVRGKTYVVLRDLHSVIGCYVAIIAIIISLTGLIYTYVWGKGFQYASQKTEAYDMFSKPMLSKCAPEAKDLPLDRIIEIAQQRMPSTNLTVWFPRAARAVYLVTANNARGPQVNELLFLDRATGEILDDR